VECLEDDSSKHIIILDSVYENKEIGYFDVWCKSKCDDFDSECNLYDDKTKQFAKITKYKTEINLSKITMLLCPT